jgi:alpha-glucosidase (family GH31 glycosyl hydrolase)
MRALIEEPNSERFKISEEGLPIADDQLHSVNFFNSHVTVSEDDLTVDFLPGMDAFEFFSYRIDFDHFKITQFAGEETTMIINPVDSLYLESGADNQSVSLGFYFPATRLFGLPEREDTFMLKNTESNPYELFATDQFAHEPNNQQPLYGSVPYVTSLDETHSAAVTWVNSAHTWVSISDMDDGKYVNFVSESGALELFVFAAKNNGDINRVKKV